MFFKARGLRSARHSYRRKAAAAMCTVQNLHKGLPFRLTKKVNEGTSKLSDIVCMKIQRTVILCVVQYLVNAAPAKWSKVHLFCVELVAL